MDCRACRRLHVGGIVAEEGFDQNLPIGERPRYEVKLTCDEVYLADVRAWVRLHPDSFVVTYRPRRVNSLYLDTHGADCLDDSLAGVDERTKVRFRWYGEDYSRVEGIVELKRKSGRVGWKETHPVRTAFDLTSISWPDFMLHLAGRVDDALLPWLCCTGRPTLITSYVREYYESMDRRVRLTVDRDLAAYEQVMRPAPNLRVKAPGWDRIVIEVKGDPTLHTRLSGVLSSLPLVVTRNSKYVSGLTASLAFI